MTAAKRRRGKSQVALVGAHVSSAGGAWRAFDRAAGVGANCFAIFVKSNVQWRMPAVGEADIKRFHDARTRTGIDAVVAHASYLVNLATADRAIRRKSILGLAGELELTARYGIEWLVVHPGNHMDAGRPRGMQNAARGLREALSRVDGAGILVETTAGAGTALGATLEEIAEIISLAGGGERLGACVDTSHVFAAGYDIAHEEGYGRLKEELASLGLDRLVKAVHVNDSKGALGSRVDRHEHIGKGRIGRAAFAWLMRDADFARVPKILETPKGKCGGRDCDAVNIALLRRLARPARG